MLVSDDRAYNSVDKTVSYPEANNNILNQNYRTNVEQLTHAEVTQVVVQAPILEQLENNLIMNTKTSSMVKKCGLWLQ